MSDVIRCIIVDDEPLARQILEGYVEMLPGLTLAGSFQRPLEALAFLQQKPVDLVFLDIQMPKLTGLDFAKGLTTRPSTIFTTAYREFALEGFELEAVDYLLKPITLPRFLKAVNKFRGGFKSVASSIRPPAGAPSSGGRSLYVNSNKRHVKVDFEDILYVESRKDYVCIHTLSGEVTTKAKISDYEEMLGDGFLRCHRSFLINVARVTAFTALDVEFGEVEVPIGGSYKQLVWDRLKQQ